MLIFTVTPNTKAISHVISTSFSFVNTGHICVFEGEINTEIQSARVCLCMSVYKPMGLCIRLCERD